MYLLWKHVSVMYNEDLECGLKLLPKLTADHIYLNSYSVMKVKLATQILSRSVGNVLQTFGPPEAKKTAEFCLKFDDFFDIFNVRYPRAHKDTKKKFLQPFSGGKMDAKRFKFLDSFVQYLDEWKKSTMERSGEFSQTDRNNMFLSHQTHEGVKMSIYSLKELVPYLRKNGVKYILTGRFNQDDVENYFGRQRAIGRRKDSPNNRDSLYADNLIKTQYDTSPISGNVECPVDTEIDFTPMKKRRRRSYSM